MGNIENKKIVIQNLLINYYQLKSDSKLNVLFLHGWRSQSSVWTNIMNSLGENGFSSYAIDLPGFGKSDVPKEAFDVQKYGDVVSEFIDKLKLEDVVLVGHSLGGRISIKLCQNNKKIVKIILVDSAGIKTNENEKKVINAAAKVVKPIFQPEFMQNLRKEIYKAIGSEDYVETPYLKETYLNVINEDLSSYLPGIKQPTLIIWGEKDKDTPIEFAHMMKNSIKESNLVVLQNAGHYSFLDQPEEFKNSLLNFIQ